MASPESRSVSGANAIATIGGIAALLIVVKAKFFAPSLAMSSLDAVIPIGLTFCSLRCIHYVIEGYKQKLEPHSFRQYCAYLFFLPTLAYGPVHRFPAYLTDARRHRWDPRKFAKGLERILFGYVKITFVSHFLFGAFLATKIAAIGPEHVQLITYLTVLGKGFSLYFLLSGYADVAIGFALLLGFRVMEDFKWPFFSANISDFYRSWHISLSSWCREYIYVPALAITRRPRLAGFAAMVIFALWHEISVNYLIWGAFNGIGIVVWQEFRQRAMDRPAEPRAAVRWIKKVFSILFTVHFMVFGFVFVSNASLDEVWNTYRKLFGWS